MNTVGDVFRMFSGRELVAEDVVSLESDGMVLAQRINCGAATLYLVSAQQEFDAAAYARICQDADPEPIYSPQIAENQIYQTQIYETPTYEPTYYANSPYEPEPYAAPTFYEPQYVEPYIEPPYVEPYEQPPYAEPPYEPEFIAGQPYFEPPEVAIETADSLFGRPNPWDDEHFREMWGHPAQAELDNAPFEPQMPPDYYELRSIRLADPAEIAERERIQEEARLIREARERERLHELEEREARNREKLAQMESQKLERAKERARLDTQLGYTKKGKRRYNAMLTAFCILLVCSISFLVYRSLESSTAARQGDALGNLYTRDTQQGAVMPTASSSVPSTQTTANSDVSGSPTETEQVQESDGLPSFAALKEINPDIIGWIKIPGTQTDNPVLQSKNDPNFYLSHDFYGQPNRLGAIYMDAANTIGSTQDTNLTLYGHHAIKGTMFGELKSYLGLSFYKQHPTFTFDTLYEQSDWAVFAVFVVSANTDDPAFFDWRTANFDGDDAFNSFIAQCKQHSMITTTVDVSPGDRIVNLATCSYEFENARLVVFARQLRPGETINAENATTNPNPLDPLDWNDE
jgi:sortase B